MIIHLEREYWPGGTNGTLTIDGYKIGHTIEKPWKRNRDATGCIPEGTFKAVKQYSEELGWHLELMQVPGRQKVLISHKQPQDCREVTCIIPVSKLNGEGKGTHPKIAFEKFKEIAFAILEEEDLMLEIKSYPDAALNLIQFELSWMD
jgi:hypothetical protein